MFTINGYKGGLVYAEQNFSELGNKLCEMNPKLDFIAMVEPTKGFVSIRSRKDDIDVGKILQYHLAAAVMQNQQEHH